MDNLSLSNEKNLSNVGITLKDDGTLSLDEEAFKKADSASLKSLFGGAGSYGRDLAFCIMNEGAVKMAPSRNVQDKICSVLCDLGR